ncbi:hypothetical protein I4U23_022866 [Adineta vaga]|nr:hypothetical protein I4U23_022866 [Adineta vaga]
MAYSPVPALDDLSVREWNNLTDNLEQIINFCQRVGLLHTYPIELCPKLHNNWYLGSCSKSIDKCKWRCRHSKLKLQQILDLMMYWCQRLDSHKFIKRVGVGVGLGAIASDIVIGVIGQPLTIPESCGQYETADDCRVDIDFAYHDQQYKVTFATAYVSFDMLSCDNNDNCAVEFAQNKVLDLGSRIFDVRNVTTQLASILLEQRQTPLRCYDDDECTSEYFNKVKQILYQHNLTDINGQINPNIPTTTIIPFSGGGKNTKTDDSHKKTNEILSTRIYISFLIIILSLFVLYSTLSTESSLIAISKPIQEKFEELQLKYSSSLKCPCKNLSIPYEEFIDIKVQYNEICLSNFVSQQWIDLFYFQNLSYYHPLDFRRSAPFKFQLLRTLCQQSKQIIDNNLEQFYSNHFVTNQLVSMNIFNIQMDSFIKYEQIRIKYPNSLTCPCNEISIKYEKFIKFEQIYHHVCSSYFVSQEWIDYLHVAEKIDEGDFRSTGSSQFQTLASLCRLTEETINLNLQQFYSTTWISNELISNDLFKKSTLQTFKETFDTTREILHYGNALISIFQTNWKFISYYDQNHKSPFYTNPMTYNNQSCTCATSLHCSEPLILNDKLVIGLFIGCYPVEATLQSSLKCFYHRECIILIQSSFIQEPLIRTNR